MVGKPKGSASFGGNTYFAQTLKTPGNSSVILSHYSSYYYRVLYGGSISISIWNTTQCDGTRGFGSIGLTGADQFDLEPSTRISDWYTLHPEPPLSFGELWTWRWMGTDLNITLSSNTTYAVVTQVNGQSKMRGVLNSYDTIAGDAYPHGNVWGSENAGATWDSWFLISSGYYSSRDSTFKATFTTLSTPGANITSSPKDRYPFINQAGIDAAESGNSPPSANFTISPADPETNETITFNDTSYDDGAIVSWLWHFGDGSTASTQNATHQYTSAGLYAVSLNVTDNDSATDSITKLIVVNESRYSADDWDGDGIPDSIDTDDDNDGIPDSDDHYPYNPNMPNAAFTYSISGAVITFTDQSQDPDGSIVNRTWDLGDGNISYQQNPVHTYSVPEFTVTLMVTDDDGFVDTVSKGIFLYGNADFTYNPLHPYINDIVHFADTSNNQSLITARAWGFGDGVTMAGSDSITHSYGNAGTYTASLAVTYRIGMVCSASKGITVNSDAPPSPPPSPSDNNSTIPPIQPPKYPDKPPAPPGTEAYTIPQMYRMIGLDNQTAKGKIKIAVIDTGVFPRVYNNGIDMNIDMNDIWTYGIAGGIDDHGHGTFTNAEVQWVVENNCPNVIQYSIKALNSDGEGTYNSIMDAIRIAEGLHVDIISMSFGARGKLGDIFSDEVGRLRSKGIVVVAAAGNDGPSRYTIISPALSGNVIAVGSEDPMHTLTNVADDEVCSWSSRGPVAGLYEAKPDVVAGGESIIGPALNSEVIWSGTSLSTPIISGGIAYMMSANYNKLRMFDMLYFWHRSLKVKLVEKSLEDSCTPLSSGSQYDYGAGLPDIQKATNLLERQLFIYNIVAMFALALLLVAIVLIAYFVYRRYK